MKLGRQIKEWLSVAMLVAGAALFISSLSVTKSPGDTSGAARRVERIAARRLALLDSYIDKALAQDPDIVSEAAAEFAPKHKNVVTYPAGRSLTDAVFAAVRK